MQHFKQHCACSRCSDNSMCRGKAQPHVDGGLASNPGTSHANRGPAAQGVAVCAEALLGQVDAQRHCSTVCKWDVLVPQQLSNHAQPVRSKFAHRRPAALTR